MIRPTRGAGYFFAYDLVATKTNGTKFKQSYYDDEFDELLVDKKTIEELGYTNVKIVERNWHKKGTRKYG